MKPFITIAVIAIFSGMMLPVLTFSQTYIPARPTGEIKLVNDFICEEVVYPESSLEANEEGVVVLGFVVHPDGSVSDLFVRQGISPAIDAEAVRVFRLLLWEPAIKLGNPVTSEQEFSFKFNIKKYKRHCKQRGYEKSDYPFVPVDSSLTVYAPGQLDQSPEPIFDEKGMTIGKFITQNLIYPAAAYKQNISGQVVLSFVIETHGRASNVLIEKPVGGGCTEEALRIMKLIRWRPGIKDGRAVRSRMNLNIIFNLQHENELRVFDNNQGSN